MAELLFNEETHKYTMGGVTLPSVTTVMRPLYDFSMVDKEVLRLAGEFGTAVHKTVELYLLSDLDEETLDPALIGPLEAFKAWQADYPQLQGRFHVENRMADARLLYAGTADLIIDAEAVIDIKTRKANQLTDPIQLEAYERLWLKNGGTKGKYDHRVLELNQDGTYQYVKAAHRDAWSRFRFLLDHHNNNLKIQTWRTCK